HAAGALHLQHDKIAGVRRRNGVGDGRRDLADDTLVRREADLGLGYEPVHTGAVVLTDQLAQHRRAVVPGVIQRREPDVLALRRVRDVLVVVRPARLDVDDPRPDAGGAAERPAVVRVDTERRGPTVTLLRLEVRRVAWLRRRRERGVRDCA